VAQRPQFALPCARVINAVDQWRASPVVKSHTQHKILDTFLLGNERDRPSANLDHWNILLQLNGQAIISGQETTNILTRVYKKRYINHVCPCETSRLYLRNTSAQTARDLIWSIASHTQRYCRSSDIGIRRPDLANSILTATMGSAYYWNGPQSRGSCQYCQIYAFSCCSS
jgi:hypothetical protein